MRPLSSSAQGRRSTCEPRHCGRRHWSDASPRCTSARRLWWDELEMPGDDWRRVAQFLHADDEVNSVVVWVHEGSLMNRIHMHVLGPLRDKMLNGFLKELEIQASYIESKCLRLSTLLRSGSRN